jgi:predicted cupin superfamily sugar epimerase
MAYDGGGMTAPTVENLIRSLGLVRHPEGGWYRETYRSGETAPAASLPERFGGSRSFGTAIYFLLDKGDVSALHRIKSDELWHFYAGATLTVHLLTPQGEHGTIRLGRDLEAGEAYQAVVPAGCWFGAEVSGAGDYSLVGCTVAPGFDFADFELGSRESLLKQFPGHADLIQRLSAGRAS